jgi:hypothetical protein
MIGPSGAAPSLPPANACSTVTTPAGVILKTVPRPDGPAVLVVP